MSIKMRFWLLSLIFLNGYVSLSLELLACRQLSYYVGSSAVITSIIIGVFLGFMSWGYFSGARPPGPMRKNQTLCRILRASFLMIAVMTVLACSFSLITHYFQFMYDAGIRSGIVQTFLYAVVFLSAAPFLFGFNTAVLSRYLHRYGPNYTGNIMAWDTIGSVLGSLLTTLLLMPFLGVNHTIILLILLALLGALACGARAITILIWFPMIMIPACWINSDAFLYKNYGIIENNAVSTIAIAAETGSQKALMMNGLPMSVYDKRTERSAAYVDYVNDIFIDALPAYPLRDILVLGAGGFTMGLKDKTHTYTFVDIDKSLLKISERHFLEKKLTPNKNFVVRDASQFLKNTDKYYDLIILDVYSNSYQVPADLITVEFMQRIKSRLKPGGIVVMNIIADPAFNDKFSRNFDNTLRAVFTNNVSRQVIGEFDPWASHWMCNIIYAYYNKPNSNAVYRINKNPVIYDR
jgi:spermidine synthase